MENPKDQEQIEKIEALNPEGLAYGVAMQLNHKYDFGGYSVGRSERSFLLDMYFRLNRRENDQVPSLNPFSNYDLFLKIAKSKLLKDYLGNRTDLDIKNPKDLSCIILRIWLNHYRDRVAKLEDDDINFTEKDFSFVSELGVAELIYGLYIQSNDVNEGVLDEFAKQFIDESIVDI